MKSKPKEVMAIKPKEVMAIEHEGVLYKSREDLKNRLAEHVIWKSYNYGEWCLNPKETFLKLKEIYDNDD